MSLRPYKCPNCPLIGAGWPLSWLECTGPRPSSTQSPPGTGHVVEVDRPGRTLVRLGARPPLVAAIRYRSWSTSNEGARPVIVGAGAPHPRCRPRLVLPRVVVSGSFACPPLQTLPPSRDHLFGPHHNSGKVVVGSTLLHMHSRPVASTLCQCVSVPRPPSTHVASCLATHNSVCALLPASVLSIRCLPPTIFQMPLHVLRLPTSPGSPAF